jgi:predicted transcriptional regulator
MLGADRGFGKGRTIMPKALVELTSEIVASFVSHNSVPRSELRDLIQTIHDRLKQIEAGLEVALPQLEPKTPAVPIRRSVLPDYLICLDDGLRFRTLRRHLATLGMTPEQYREKWNLPHDYPMVAPSYAARRSALAKQMDLGQKGKGARPKRG